MGLLDGLLGNATKVAPLELQSELRRILLPTEHVEHAYMLVRDFFVFTNCRLLMVDKQGLTGKKIEYHSIPYKSIIHFSIETVGHFDLDAELKIWLSGSQTPLEKKFNREVDVYEVQCIMASYVLGHALPASGTGPVAGAVAPLQASVAGRTAPPPLTMTAAASHSPESPANPWQVDHDEEARILMHAAREAIQRKEGRTAVELLRQIVEQHPESQHAQPARNYLAGLKRKQSP